MRVAGSDGDLPWAEVIDELHAFVARRVANPADASEITSAVIERVHRRADQLRDDDRFTAWVLAAARNAVIDHYRSTARRRDRPASEIADLGEVELLDTDPSADIREELAACVAPLLADLPVHYREALMLTEFDGLTQAQAAERVSVSLSGMKSRVQRARQQLRERYERCCDITVDARGAPISFEPRNGRSTSPDRVARRAGSSARHPGPRHPEP